MSMPYLYSESGFWYYFACPERKVRSYILFEVGGPPWGKFYREDSLSLVEDEVADLKVSVPSEFLT